MADLFGGDVTDSTFGIPLGKAVLFTHEADKCDGEYCVLHNPSDHHMRHMRTLWRADRNLMERICEHGVGHPDPDDLAYHQRNGREWQANHGCDGCCHAP